MTNVLVVGPVNSFGGYATTARNFIDAFINLGVDVRYQEFTDYKGGYPLEPDRALEYVQRRIEHSPGWTPDYIVNCMSMGYRKAKDGIKTMAHTGWEGDRLHPDVIDSIGTQDVVGVWSKELQSLYQQYHDNVQVIPIGINTNVFKPLEYKKDDFRFVVNGKWEYRKNFTNLIRAFSKTFADNPNVSLTIKTTPYAAQPQEIADIVSKANKHNAKVNLTFRDFNERQLAMFYNEHDVYFHPSRSEGFGIPMLEAMSCGLPLITSAEGGHLEFADENVSLFVKGKQKAVIPHHAYTQGTMMFEPSMEDMMKKLRYAYNNQDQMRKMGEAARERALEYDQVKIAQRILDVFESL